MNHDGGIGDPRERVRPGDEADPAGKAGPSSWVFRRMRPDDDDNKELYGKPITNREILTGTIAPPASAGHGENAPQSMVMGR